MDDESEKEALQEALRETQEIIEYQFELAQSAEDDILRIVRLNLVVIGAVIPLITNVRDLVLSSMEFLLLPYFLVIYSLFAAVYIYQSSPLYIGFSDSPQMDYSNTFSDTEEISYLEFAHDLLQDHEDGILHNNVEIKYRITIYRHSVILVIISIFLISIGLLLSMTSGNLSTFLFIMYIFSSISSILPIRSSLREICEFADRYEDNQRFDYEYYGHARVYQIRKFICKFFRDE